MSEYKDGRGDYYLAAGMTDQPVPAATDWRTLVCGVCGWSMQTQSPYDLVISHGNTTHRMSVRAAPAPTAPAGMREAAIELITVMRDTYPEGERHLSVADALAALEAAIASPSEEPDATHQDDDGNPTYPGHRESLASPSEEPGLDVATWRSMAAALDDELRRVEAGYSTPESMARARMTYARLAKEPE